MKITPVPFSLILDRDSGRSTGVHLTQITSVMAFASGALDKKYKDSDINDQSGVYRVAAGLAWEEWISSRHKHICFHPGEFMLDDVAMTPDGISYDDDDVPRVHEFKFTWKSMRREYDLHGEWMWMTQIACYCCAVGTNRATLHVFWANGDYRDSGPQYKLYDIEFTERELKEIWESVKNNIPM